MVSPRVANGGTSPNMEVISNVLNNQMRTVDKGWSSSLGVGRDVNNSSL